MGRNNTTENSLKHHISREKQRARSLRKTDWWKNKIQQGVCSYCLNAVGAEALTMDHVIALSAGGMSDKNNIVACCKSCNTNKNSLSVIEWVKYLDAIRNDK